MSLRLWEWLAVLMLASTALLSAVLWHPLMSQWLWQRHFASHQRLILASLNTWLEEHDRDDVTIAGRVNPSQLGAVAWDQRWGSESLRVLRQGDHRHWVLQWTVRLNAPWREWMVSQAPQWGWTSKVPGSWKRQVRLEWGMGYDHRMQSAWSTYQTKQLQRLLVTKQRGKN